MAKISYNFDLILWKILKSTFINLCKVQWYQIENFSHGKLNMRIYNVFNAPMNRDILSFFIHVLLFLCSGLNAKNFDKTFNPFQFNSCSTIQLNKSFPFNQENVFHWWTEEEKKLRGKWYWVHSIDFRIDTESMCMYIMNLAGHDILASEHNVVLQTIFYRSFLIKEN